MVRESLQYNFNAREDNRVSLEKRIANVQAFSQLDRTNLAYQQTERRILLHTTTDDEKVYIQYPGKESARARNTKPWDFRPKLVKDGLNMRDLSFADIWDDIAEMHETDAESIAVLSAVFFRMAYLIDYKRVTENCPYEDVDIETNTIVNTGMIELSWYQPNFPQEVYEYLKEKVGNIRDFSPEAYLFMNDLLAQNEDCKYYYREVIERGNRWNGKPGRENTLLSHLSCIEYITGNIKFSEIMERFQKGMGVAPIPNRSVNIVTDGIITR